MTPTTRSAQAARTRSDRLADALHTLADLVGAESIPTDGAPYALSLVFMAESVAEVARVAERFGVTVEVARAVQTRATHTTATIEIGEGMNPNIDGPMHRCAIQVRIAHIQPAEIAS